MWLWGLEIGITASILSIAFTSLLSVAEKAMTFLFTMQLFLPVRRLP